MSDPEDAPLRAVVVGAGAGGSLSIGALQASPLFQLVAVADVRPDARERVENDNPAVATYSSYTEMFCAVGPDVVCVSTYANSHLDIMRSALTHGARGLLVEKPLGETARVGEAIIGTAKDAGIPIVVPHGLMATSSSVKIVDEVHNGAIGELLFVEMECTGWDLINAGIHWLQFFVALLGDDEVTSVLSTSDVSTRTFRDGLQVETEAITLARSARGVRLFLNTGDSVPISRRRPTVCLIRIVGTSGFIEFGAFEQEFDLVTTAHQRTTIEVEAYAVSGHRRYLESLAVQMRSGVFDWTLVNASLKALEIVDAAYLSHRLRSSVSLPLGPIEPLQPNDWDPGAVYSGVGGGRDGRAL